MARGTVWLMFAHFMLLVSGYAVHFGLGRLFDPPTYGRFGVAISLMSLIEILVATGVPQAVNKFLSESRRDAGRLMYSSFKVQGILAVSLFIAYFYFAGFSKDVFGEEGFTTPLRITAFDIPFYALFTLYVYGFFGGFRRFKNQAGLFATYATFKVVFILGLVKLGYGLEGALIGYVLTSVCTAALAAALWDTKAEKGAKDKKIIGFSMPLIVFSLTFTALMSLDILFLQGMLKDKALTGFYTSASVISKLPYYGFLALSATLLPSVSKAYAQGDMQQTRSYIKNSLRYIYILSLPLALLLSGFSKQILELIYSRQYAVAAHALSILAFGLTFLSFFYMLSTIVTASGKPYTSMGYAISLLPVNVILNIILIPRYGLKGAAVATTMTGLLGVTALGAYVYLRFKTLIGWKTFFRTSAIGAATVYLAQSFDMGGLPLIPYLAICYISYLVLLWLVKELGEEDVKVVKEVLNRR